MWIEFLQGGSRGHQDSQLPPTFSDAPILSQGDTSARSVAALKMRA
jgi:hypothetical protein